jgi:uncharacterized protein YndB with AHSA1/START domain
VPETKTTVEPVRKSVTVSVAPPRAFEFFTRDIGRWWPLATHSVGLAEAASVSFGVAVGDQLVETGAHGTKEIWGTVLRSEPPRRIAISWHPGRSEDEATLVEVTFTPDSAGGTVVELVHSGWERWADGETRADNYRQGWDPVLRAFVDQAGA